MKRRKNRMISMRLTEAQYQKIESLISDIKHSSGFNITRASVLLKMLEYGLPELEKEIVRMKYDDSKSA